MTWFLMNCRGNATRPNGYGNHLTLEETVGPRSTLHSGAASGLRKFLAKVEISAGLLELVQALLPEFKTVFRLNFKQVLRKI